MEEYNQLCNLMESKIEELVASSTSLSTSSEEMHTKLRESLEEDDSGLDQCQTESAQEAFWRKMGRSEERFE